jgi:hypothetical protein
MKNKELIEALKLLNPEAEVVIVTGSKFGEITSTEAVRSAGIFGYAKNVAVYSDNTKPFVVLNR